VTFLIFPRLKMKLKACHFWHNQDDRDRIAGSAEHPHRTWLPGWI
jgi:hypothetical protein